MADGNTTVNVHQEEVVHAIETLRQEVQRGNAETVKEVRRISETAARTELAKQQAEAEAIGPVIDRQKTQLQRLFQQIRSFLQAVKAKFDLKEKELKQSYRRDIRRLGAHIFEILEDECQRGIENRIKAADFDVFVGLTGKFYDARNRTLNEWLNRAKDSARRFADKRRQFRSTLKSVHIARQDSENPEFAIPFWIIEVEDSGKVQTRVITVSRLAPSAGPYPFRLEPLEEYDAVREMVERKIESVKRQFMWRDTSASEKNGIAAEVEKLASAGASEELRRIIAGQLERHPLSIA